MCIQITFLGTSAGESYPGLWCECDNCTYAREHGGPNIRGNSSILVDDDILVDMNAHSFEMFTRLRLSPAKIRYLLVTHPHLDHFVPETLLQRNAKIDFFSMSQEQFRHHISPCFTDLPILEIHGNAFVREALNRVPRLMDDADQNRIVFHPITEGIRHTCETFSFIPLRSVHGPVSGFAHSYILERNDKCVLFALDTGGYDPDMLSILLSYQYDCVIMEGTFGLGVSAPTHMSLEKNKIMYRLLCEKNVWKNEPRFILTHICPHWSPPHDIYAPMVREEGMTLAYDGKIVTF